MKTDIFDIKPMFEEYSHQGPEHSVRELIYKYYLTYFDQQAASEFTERYISEIIKHEWPGLPIREYKMKTNLDTLEHSPVDNSVAHTPGKWDVNGTDVEVELADGDFDGYLAKIAACGDSYVLSDKQIHANAALISAAPDLLIAVESLLEELHRTRKMDVKKDYSLMVDIEACRMAIRKAKGD